MKKLLSVAVAAGLFVVGCDSPAPAKKDDKKATTPVKPVDAPKTEAPKTEAPKTEAPKTEAPKTEAPKVEKKEEKKEEKK